MAKVEGPLMSMEARGKIGNAVVFFPWKGRHAVRRWLKPTNPRRTDQQIIRQKLAALGKCLGAIKTPDPDDLAAGSAVYQEIKTLVTTGQIWNAFLVKKALDFFKVDADYVEFAGAITALGHYSSWTEAAGALNLHTLYATDIKYATDVPPGVQLAMAAYGCYAMGYKITEIDMSIAPSELTDGAVDVWASGFTNAPS